MKLNKLNAKARKKAVEKLTNAAGMEYKRTKDVYEKYYLICEKARKFGGIGLWDKRKLNQLHGKLLKIKEEDRNIYTTNLLQYFPTFLAHSRNFDVVDYEFISNDLIPYIKSCERKELRGFSDTMLGWNKKITGDDKL